MNASMAEKIAWLPYDQRAEVIRSLSEDEAVALLSDWRFWAREQQLPPDGDWFTWLILAGRGWGKTVTGAQFVRDFGLRHPQSRIAIVAPTYADARDICIEGESGLLNILGDNELALWNRSLGEMVLKNGTRYKLFSADKPDRLRGPQHHVAWCDEMGSWRYVQDAWDMLLMGLRLGDNPRAVITTTPRPIPIIKKLLTDKDVYVTRGTTYDNKANLAPGLFQQIAKRYLGTRLGRQEIFAEILDDVPGALWTHAKLEENRRGHAPSLVRVVIAVDPAVTANAETSNETGIVVAGVDENDEGYVLDDLSGIHTPMEWAKKVIGAYDHWHADAIVGEVNNGGDLVKANVLSTAEIMHLKGERGHKRVNFREVRASRGKYVRAEPVSSLDEQGRIHHVGMFALLEDQLTSWVPGEDSPDRLDARVWAFTDLMLTTTERQPSRSREY